MTSTEPKTVAVTGANGYIGAHVCAGLLDAGLKVRACVRDPGNAQKVSFLKKIAEAKGAADRLELFRGDLLDEGSYAPAFEGADVVVHTAAVVDLSGGNAQNTIDAAVIGTTNVMACARSSKSVRRLVNVSSVSAIMDESKADDHVFTEADWNNYSTVETGDPYGYAKVTSERLFWKEAKAAGLEAVSINPAMVIGPALHPSHCKGTLGPLCWLLVGGGENPPEKAPSWKIYHCPLRMVDVRDVAKACVRAALSDHEGVLGRRHLLANDSAPKTFAQLLPDLQRLFPKYALAVPPEEPKTEAEAPEDTSSFYKKYVSRTGPIYDNAYSKEFLMREGYLSMEDSLAQSIETMVSLGVQPNLASS